MRHQEQILFLKGLEMQIDGKFVDAVYGVEGLRSLKDQLSIGHTYYTEGLAETYGHRGPESSDRYIHKNRSFMNRVQFYQPSQLSQLSQLHGKVTCYRYLSAFKQITWKSSLGRSIQTSM